MSQFAKKLNWPPLEQRRKAQWLTLLYKIVYGEVTPDQLGLVSSDQRTKASHRHKFRQCPGSTKNPNHLFLNVTVNEWNILLDGLAAADLVLIFKSWLAVQLG